MKWTEAEKEYLIQNYGKIPTDEICDYLERERELVVKKVAHLRSKGIQMAYIPKPEGKKKKGGTREVYSGTPRRCEGCMLNAEGVCIYDLHNESSICKKYYRYTRCEFPKPENRWILI